MIEKWIYKHYKWSLYKVLWLAMHSETEEKLVIYKALYEIPKLEKEFWKEPLFVRPYEMFSEYVEFNGKKIKRFELIGKK